MERISEAEGGPCQMRCGYCPEELCMSCLTDFPETPQNISSRKTKEGWAQWLMPVIPALGVAESGGSQIQEFETSLANMVKPHLYQKYKN